MDKVCQQLSPEDVYKQFGRTSKLLLHPKHVPNIKLLKEKETINRENNQGNDKDHNVTLCELTELHPQEEVKDKKMDNESSKESINRFGFYNITGHTKQCNIPRKCGDPSNKGKNLFICSGEIRDDKVSSHETNPRECDDPSGKSKISLNRSGKTGSGEVSSHVK